MSENTHLSDASERLKNPPHFQFLQRVGTWSYDDSGTILMTQTGPKAVKMPLLMMDWGTKGPGSPDKAMVARLIAKAPEMAALLDTVAHWAPTILKHLPPLDGQFLLEVFTHINELLDEVEDGNDAF